MDMDKTACSLDTTDNPGADTQILAPESSFHTVAPKTATCSVVGVGQSSHIPNPTETGTNVTRLHRLHEAVKVEAVSVAQKGSQCGTLTLRHRHGNVTSPS